MSIHALGDVYDLPFKPQWSLYKPTYLTLTLQSLKYPQFYVKSQFVPHSKLITSPLQNPTG
jgi:hypothetical protein